MRASKPSRLQATSFLSRLQPEQYAWQGGLVFTLMAIGVAGRLLPHLPNITPVGALAIWGGMRLGGKPGAGLLLGTMLISDLFLGFHPTVWFVYAGLLAALWLASQVKRVSFLNVAGTTLTGAVIFFLITNFGVWYMSRFFSTPLYPPTLVGLWEAYIAGIPFFRYSLAGDVAYVALFFGLEYVAFTLAAKQGIVKNVAK